jgi:flagellar biosynthesis/type III secretory pathway chaperone
MAVKTDDKRAVKQAQELQRALQADLLLAKQMLCVLNAQTEALIAGDHRSVAMMERHCRELVKEQAERDGVRETAVAAVAMALALGVHDGPPPRLSDLALQLPLPEARAVLALRRQILSTHDHIRRANERNRALLENALDCVESTLDTIREFAFRKPAYGANPNTLTSATLCLNQTA